MRGLKDKKIDFLIAFFESTSISISNLKFDIETPKIAEITADNIEWRTEINFSENLIFQDFFAMIFQKLSIVLEILKQYCSSDFHVT